MSRDSTGFEDFFARWAWKRNPNIIRLNSFQREIAIPFVTACQRKPICSGKSILLEALCHFDMAGGLKYRHRSQIRKAGKK